MYTMMNTLCKEKPFSIRNCYEYIIYEADNESLIRLKPYVIIKGLARER
jgi:hypothetical protein